ncbi:MAG TPA: thiamine ABC transporter substrate-binding protein [Phototrophicaceae bacterium]|nr:thiamine ABC transporter substrate-binding protein [Phototrophicaceae bacterium]
MKFRFLLIVILLSLGFSSTLAQDNTLTLVTHDSFNVSEDVLAQFEKETGITVEILRSGDAGRMLNQSILSKQNPLGDVLFGVDNTFLGRALEEELFIPYESPRLETVPEQYQLDPEYQVTPIDYGDVCLNYDLAYFEENDLALPESLQALTEPEYKGLLIVENPATSSPGLAFLLATVGEFGTEGDYTYLDFWADLVGNDVLVSEGWEDAFFGQFTAGGGEGTRPLVVSYASSPPVTVVEETGKPTIGSVVADGMCFRQIEFAGILQGTDNLEGAQQFIDFLLSQPFQEDLPLQMYVFPVQPDAELPEAFAEFAAMPENPVTVAIQDINTYREEWIRAWTETVLR